MNINFDFFTLDNGLKVVLHLDPNCNVVTTNILYNVGSKDENPDCTGLAHFFEHMMFSGTKKHPKFDSFLEKVGAQNNAFTSSDITNYYITVPSNNLEHALYIESDRMLNLNLTQKNLDVQKNVVIEEFKQIYLNQPYGDIHLILRAASYNYHPYNWCPIGKEISHIEKFNIDIANQFYKNFYSPANAVLVVAGNINFNQTKKMISNYFSHIPFRKINRNPYLFEPKKTEKVELKVKKDVSSNCIVLAFHMGSRLEKNFYVSKLISSLLSSGVSSRLYNNLVKKKKIFSKIQTYLGEDFDSSLFYIKGFLNDQIDFSYAEEHVFNELNSLKNNLISEQELNKVQKKNNSSLHFSLINNSSKAIDLAVGVILNNPNLINDDFLNFDSVSIDDIKKESKKIFRSSNCTSLYYGKI